MKKRGVIVGLILMSVILTSLVAAQSSVGDSITTAVDSVVEAADPVLRYVLGDTPTGQLLFIKLLFFILLIAVIKYAADKVPAIEEKPFLSWLITIVMALLAVRFLSDAALVNFVWLPTGVLGVVLAVFLPFIIFLFFIESFDSTVIRKIGWILFAVIFFGLAIYRWDTFQSGGFNLAWMYVIVAVLSILALVFDKTIRAKIIMAAIETKGSELNQLQIAQVQQDIQRNRQIIANQASTPAAVNAARNAIKDAEKRIKAILKA